MSILDARNWNILLTEHVAPSMFVKRSLNVTEELQKFRLKQ